MLFFTLSLFVLGQASFLAAAPTISLAAPYSSDPISIIGNEFISTQTAQLVRSRRAVESPIIREDYKYTRDIGGHKLHPAAAKWTEAKSICTDEGGRLAIINSIEESNIIVQLLTESEPHSGSVDSDYAFIGFHDLYEEGNYETVDGQSLSEAGFNQWIAGEPDNGNGGQAENCGTIYKDGRLSDAACTKRYAFICELPFPDFPPDHKPPHNEQDMPIGGLIRKIKTAWRLWKLRNPTTTTTRRPPPSSGRRYFVPSAPHYNWNYQHSGLGSNSETLLPALGGAAVVAGLGAAAVAAASAIGAAAPLALAFG